MAHDINTALERLEKNLSELDALYIKAKTELNKRNQTEL